MAGRGRPGASEPSGAHLDSVAYPQAVDGDIEALSPPLAMLRALRQASKPSVSTTMMARGCLGEVRPKPTPELMEFFPWA